LLQNNTAAISGGAICLHSETNQLAVNVYCGLITDNIAVRYEGTNSINQEGGILTIYGGEIEAGISVGLGTYADLRPGADERQLTMKIIKKIMVFLFPLGIVYCVIHALSKDLYTFLGSLIICLIGVGLGVYLAECGFWQAVYAKIMYFVEGFK
jgi:hypothetical protein